jgi:hypothetical protein
MNPSMVQQLTDDRTRELLGGTPRRRRTFSDGVMRRRALAAMHLLRAGVSRR